MFVLRHSMHSHATSGKFSQVSPLAALDITPLVMQLLAFFRAVLYFSLTRFNYNRVHFNVCIMYNNVFKVFCVYSGFVTVLGDWVDNIQIVPSPTVELTSPNPDRKSW